ncbi:MAG: AMP-binding protein [Deltaproteobacteria bacterium]|jgi:acyl-CoA synthetase (AMP-forming)/AMP-acid ligase II|nr:AMP-binding protein [Deltaproteobacteria bacterium]
MTDAPFNIASLLAEAAGRHPDRRAVVSRRGPDCLGRASLTFAQLEEDSGRFSSALADSCLEPGDRVMVMVPPGLDFFVVVFGLFKAGLVPVMVDPGMGLKRMLLCLSEGRPKGLAGVRLAHLTSLCLPRFFRTLKHRVTLGRRLGWGGQNLAAMLTSPSPPRPLAAVQANDPAAVLFTSGATGPAKGAVYTHGMFRAQIELLRDSLGLAEGGVDMATFPLFALFSAALGRTAIIPDMNPVKPGQADPRRLAAAIDEEKATSLFASPTLLARLAAHAKEHRLTFGGLRQVISAGAPIQPQLAAAVAETLSPEGRLLTPYGATEAMPLTCIDAKEIAEVRGMTEQGFGMCVGRPLPGHQLTVVGLTDEPLKSFGPKQILPAGELGELTACGPVVAREYFDKPQQTELTMTVGPDAAPWRRMGDVGWLDAQGRAWFCGRKSQRVTTAQGTLFTVSCESLFNNHPLVRRSALVGVGPKGAQQPVMIVEPVKRLSRSAWAALVEELKALGRTNPRTRHIALFLKRRSFPTDVRHNAKIGREKLAVWASAKLQAAGLP